MDDDKLLLKMTTVCERKFAPKVQELVNSILSDPEIGDNAALQCAAIGGISAAMSNIIAEKFEEIQRKLGIKRIQN